MKKAYLTVCVRKLYDLGSRLEIAAERAIAILVRGLRKK